MEKEFDSLVKTLNKFEGFNLIDTSADQSWIHFKLNNESTLNVISNQISEIKEYYPCNLLVLANQKDPKDYSYQLVIESLKKEETIKMLQKKLANILENNGDLKKAKHK